MKGKLIVIEGGDGSGKATQTELLKKYFASKKIKTKSISFPQYKSTFFGKTIARVLRGEIAPLHQINPYLISMVYAMDRAEAKDKLYQWLNSGNLVVLDRYVSSNMAHQTGRLPKKERSKFLKWLEEMEYKVNNVPREDIVIYLYVPYKISLALLEQRKNEKHLKGKKDIVEKDGEYLKKAEETYLFLNKRFSHWVRINCIDKKGIMRPREEIHEERVRVLSRKHLINL